MSHSEQGSSEQDQLTILSTRLEQGQLSTDEQQELAELLGAPASQVVMTARQQIFSGPLPPPDQLNQYDEHTRQVIVDMAQREQTHAHETRHQALRGHIAKDKRGQFLGGLIAVVGLLVAGYVSQHSPVAAGIIASLDLVGMVSLFVAPRLFKQRSDGSPKND